MSGEPLMYEADGLTMYGRLFSSGSTSPGPGVLVFPEAFGLGEHAIGRARRLAELGYTALACDIHGGGVEHDDMATVMQLLSVLQSDGVRTRARASGAFDALRARPEVDPARIAAIGYCFGGTLALELARSGAPIVAAVGFHSGLASQLPGEVKPIKAKILACIGADDPSIGPDHRVAFEEEMRGAGIDWQLHVYGGVVHSFTSPEADARGMPEFARYDAASDRRSWIAMIDLFDEVFDQAS